MGWAFRIGQRLIKPLPQRFRGFGNGLGGNPGRHGGGATSKKPGEEMFHDRKNALGERVEVSG